MKRKAVVFLYISAILIFLCACGRNDITLTVNDDGTIDANIVYGIDKSLVAGDDVLIQVTELIKKPLDEQGIKYTETDEDNFHRISINKTFKNAAALTDSSLWQGIPFVPHFTSSQAENAITVTAQKGKINFSGTLNSDSFNVTQMLSENKKAFGASITIIAKGGKGNAAKIIRNTYKWEGTAEDTIKLDFTADYRGDELKANTELGSNAKSDSQSDSNTSNTNPNDSSDSNPLNVSDKQTESESQHKPIPFISCGLIIAASIILIILKIRKSKNSHKGDDDTCR